MSAMDNIQDKFGDGKELTDIEAAFLRLATYVKYVELATKAAEKYAEILDVGGRMSNFFFNWEQLDHSFTPAERKIMKELQERWDAAVK